MENNENSGNNEISKYQQETIDNIHIDAANKAKWRKEIEQSEKIQAYLKEFNPSSVAGFIDHLLHMKQMWNNMGEFYANANENEELQWHSAAFDELRVIQQKKLFDLQCLWRAEKITLPEVVTTFDFEVWETDILNCPFIEPVSEDDIDLYISYLTEGNVDTNSRFFLSSWQNYSSFKKNYNIDDDDDDDENEEEQEANVSFYDYDSFPEWYAFHNNFTGNDSLMLLPDIRGEKEKFYIALYNENYRKEMKLKQEAAPPLPPPDDRPILRYYDDEFMDEFVKKFETKEMYRLYKAYAWSNRNSDLEETIREDIDLLLSADEDIPVEANGNWIEALQLAAQKYRLKKIIEALPMAHESYMINIQSNIQFYSEERKTRKAIADDLKESIKQGRVLNGEPGDLNF